jgi:hypothetical protein
MLRKGMPLSRLQTNLSLMLIPISCVFQFYAHCTGAAYLKH